METQLLVDVCPHSCHYSGIPLSAIAPPRALQSAGLLGLTVTAKPGLTFGIPGFQSQDLLNTGVASLASMSSSSDRESDACRG